MFWFLSSLVPVHCVSQAWVFWVCRLLRKVVGARELWPTGSWQRPKRWPARSPRLRDLTPGKHHFHVSLAVSIFYKVYSRIYAEFISVVIVSKSRVGGGGLYPGPYSPFFPLAFFFFYEVDFRKYGEFFSGVIGGKRRGGGGGLIPGTYYTFVPLAFCIRSMSVGVVSKSRRRGV